MHASNSNWFLKQGQYLVQPVLNQLALTGIFETVIGHPRSGPAGLGGGPSSGSYHPSSTWLFVRYMGRNPIQIKNPSLASGPRLASSPRLQSSPRLRSPPRLRSSPRLRFSPRFWSSPATAACFASSSLLRLRSSPPSLCARLFALFSSRSSIFALVSFRSLRGRRFAIVSSIVSSRSSFHNGAIVSFRARLVGMALFAIVPSRSSLRCRSLIAAALSSPLSCRSCILCACVIPSSWLLTHALGFFAFVCTCMYFQLSFVFQGVS